MENKIPPVYSKMPRSYKKLLGTQNYRNYTNERLEEATKLVLKKEITLRDASKRFNIAADGKDRLLIAGDVKGHLVMFFKKINHIIEKFGPFDLLLCAGDFFGEICLDWELFKCGVHTAPIPTYILGPVSPHQFVYYSNKSGCELVQNINYLGPYGIFSTAKGVRIAYISGLDRCGQGAASDHSFSTEQVFKLRELCKKGQMNYIGIDILLSTQWPTDITELDSATKLKPSKPSELLSWLVSEIVPRYHFAAFEGLSYERAPFTHFDGEKRKVVAVTRFISLACVNNVDKRRWMYAMSLKALDHSSPGEAFIHSVNQTSIPFKNLKELKTLFEKNRQFFFQITGQKRENQANVDSRKRFRASTPSDNSGCWFCLSDPNVEKHLIISIGKHSYLALAKGGLVNEHLIISSVGHYPSMCTMPETGRIEIFHYKEVLKKYFSKQNKVAIFYERNFRSMHLQIQVVPLPLRIGEKIKKIYEMAAAERRMGFDEYPKGTRAYLLLPNESHYFHIELPDGSELIHKISGNFPMQFGREVLVQENVLNLVNKSDWHNCLETKEKETSLAQQIKKNFAPYDFTLSRNK